MRQEVLLSWIDLNFIPIRNINKKHLSYGLKQFFERSDQGFYISTHDFIKAMQENGYQAEWVSGANCAFNISEFSPCLRKEKGKL